MAAEGCDEVCEWEAKVVDATLEEQQVVRAHQGLVLGGAAKAHAWLACLLHGPWVEEVEKPIVRRVVKQHRRDPCTAKLYLAHHHLPTALPRGRMLEQPMRVHERVFLQGTASHVVVPEAAGALKLVVEVSNLRQPLRQRAALLCVRAAVRPRAQRLVDARKPF